VVKTKGFTLVELLVVVAVIAILAALLFPAVGNARATVMKTKCQNNIRQIMVACINYASDNDGVFPNKHRPYSQPQEFVNYNTELKKYLGGIPREQILFCPGPLWNARNPSNTQYYDTHYTTYQYFFNYDDTFVGTYAGAKKPDMTRLSNYPINTAMLACLTVKKPDGSVLSHSEAGAKKKLTGMNAGYPNGRVAWISTNALETFYVRGGDYLWPIPPVPE